MFTCWTAWMCGWKKLARPDPRELRASVKVLLLVPGW